MVYKEVQKDLFSVDFTKYKAAHCISIDCKMGGGIAVPMKKRFDLWGLRNIVDESIEKYNTQYPVTIYYNNVYNLITKERHFHKPTYKSLQSALEQMKDFIIEVGQKHIVMPKIGSGLDGLEWPKVSKIIKDTFEDVDVEILICYI